MHYTKYMSNPFLDNWTTQLRKGILELCILNYPILSRFKREGLVQTSVEESPEGPARKYYQLTSRGEQYLSRMNHYWESIKSGADSLRME